MKVSITSTVHLLVVLTHVALFGYHSLPYWFLHTHIQTDISLRCNLTNCSTLRHYLLVSVQVQQFAAEQLCSRIDQWSWNNYIDCLLAPEAVLAFPWTYSGRNRLTVTLSTVGGDRVKPSGTKPIVANEINRMGDHAAQSDTWSCFLRLFGFLSNVIVFLLISGGNRQF